MVTITEVASSESDESSSDMEHVAATRRSLRTKNEGHSTDEDASEASDSSNEEDSSFQGEQDDSESDLEEEEEDVSHLPLGERLKKQLEQGTGKVQRKNLKQQTTSTRLSSKNSNNKTSEAITEKPKKSKHAPTEASSRRKDFYHRQRFLVASSIGTAVDVHAHRYKPRDPRAEPLEMSSARGKNTAATTYHHSEDYAFLQEMRTTEIAALQRRIQARKLTGNRGQEQRKRYGIRHDDTEGMQNDQKELHRLLQEKAAYERQQLDRAAQDVVRENLKTAAGGAAQQKYRPKQREWKRMYMEAKYDLLQEKKGGAAAIDQILQQRRKKQKSKHSKMPSVL